MCDSPLSASSCRNRVWKPGVPRCLLDPKKQMFASVAWWFMIDIVGDEREGFGGVTQQQVVAVMGGHIFAVVDDQIWTWKEGPLQFSWMYE